MQYELIHYKPPLGGTLLISVSDASNLRICFRRDGAPGRCAGEVRLGWYRLANGNARPVVDIFIISSLLRVSGREGPETNERTNGVNLHVLI